MLTPIEIRILKRMYKLKLWKSNHMRLENLLHSGFPRHELGNVKSAIKRLINKGIIIYYHKSKNAIQLNWEYKAQIEEILENNI